MLRKRNRGALIRRTASTHACCPLVVRTRTSLPLAVLVGFGRDDGLIQGRSGRVLLFSFGSRGARALGSFLLFLLLSTLLLSALHELVDRVAAGGSLPLVSAPSLLAIRAHRSLLRTAARLSFALNLDRDIRR